jgi:hypothetical protein
MYEYAARTSRLLNIRNKITREKWGNTNDFGENEKQYVELVWTRIRHAG